MKNSAKIFALSLFLLASGCHRILNPPESEIPFPQPPELTFTPATLPEAIIGKPYIAKISVPNAVTPINDASTGDGQFPEGLVMQKQDTVHEIHITGTPQKSGVYNFRLDVNCLGTQASGQSGKKQYKIVVKEK